MFIFVAISLVYDENAIHVTYHCFMYNTVFLDFGLNLLNIQLRLTYLHHISTFCSQYIASPKRKRNQKSTYQNEFLKYFTILIRTRHRNLSTEKSFLLKCY